MLHHPPITSEDTSYLVTYSVDKNTYSRVVSVDRNVYSHVVDLMTITSFPNLNYGGLFIYWYEMGFSATLVVQVRLD